MGCPFRLYGREPGSGLDCLGLVLCSLAAIGKNVDEIESYGLRNLSVDRFLPAAGQAGLAPVSGNSLSGDVLLFRLPAAQYHLGIISSSLALVHAHAGLRRVILTPPPLFWPVERHWRILHP